MTMSDATADDGARFQFPTSDALRQAAGLEEAAAARYEALVEKLTRHNFVEHRPALAAEASATEALFRRAAARYRAASDRFAGAADDEPPNREPSERGSPRRGAGRLLVEAYAERAVSHAAMADVIALVGDPTVTSAEQFARRAAPLIATAKSAAERYTRLIGARIPPATRDR